MLFLKSCRLSTLEDLEIRSLGIDKLFLAKVAPMKLRKLMLTDVRFDSFSVHGFFRLPIFPLLTGLVLEDCMIYDFEDEDLLRPVTTLK